MPKPPMLPLIPWESVFAGGRDWESWLSAAENPAQAEKIRTILSGAALEPAVRDILSAMQRVVNVVAIAEDWCGDVARHAPLLAAMEAASEGRLRVRFISRGDHPDVFARFLTNGGEAIPKFVFLSADWVECGNWGPMPTECRRLIARGKAANNVGEARKRVAALYEADPRGTVVLQELAELVETASCIWER